jgi:3-phosphoshikimate 1-carboxyvinyltransferase
MKALIGEAENLTGEIEVPDGNMTAAAAWIIAAVTARHDANIVIKGVSMKRERSGLIDALQRMGARLEVQKRREVDGQPVADIWVRASWLRGAQIEGDVPSRMVNELPLFAVACAVADGTTIILYGKEERAGVDDPFPAIVNMLRVMDVYMEQADKGLLIEGGEHFHGGDYDAAGDPRMALALGVAGLISAEPLSVQNAECVDALYPGFWDALQRHTGGEVVLR